MRRPSPSCVAVTSVVTAWAAIAGCGTDGRAEEASVVDAWSRPTPSMAADGVLYLTVTSDVDDQLVAVEVPETVARAAELHETVAASDEPHAHGGAEPEVLSMGEVTAVELPAGEPVLFEPGGNHIMLVGLADRLERGETFGVELQLASGRVLSTVAEVSVNAPSAV